MCNFLETPETMQFNTTCCDELAISFAPRFHAIRLDPVKGEIMKRVRMQAGRLTIVYVHLVLLRNTEVIRVVQVFDSLEATY